MVEVLDASVRKSASPAFVCVDRFTMEILNLTGTSAQFILEIVSGAPLPTLCKPAMCHINVARGNVNTVMNLHVP